MTYQINEIKYNVIINRKGNKNTYIRISDNMDINVTTGYFMTKSHIKKILDNNVTSIVKMLNNREKRVAKKENFYFLGKKYDVILTSSVKDILFRESNLYAPTKEKLDKWCKKQMITIFTERLKYNYNLFDEKIPFPSLRIRTMKTRWGVCNIKTKTITLNALLIKETEDKIDYVIIHELSHLIHPNHSQNFWTVVGKYCSNYKSLRKGLKE